MRKMIVELFLIATLLSGCASTPRICEPAGAREAGIAQAMRGDDFNASVGGVCVDEKRAVFQQNYQAGYQEGKGRYCDPGSVERTGSAHGQQGRTSEFTSTTYHICENTADLRVAYQKGYQAGLKTFCSEPETENAGRAYGEKGQPPQFNPDTYSVCGQARVSRMKSAYAKGHRDGLTTFCQGIGVDTQAYQEGTQGIDRSDTDAKYKLCTIAKRKEFTRLSKLNYQKGLAEFCSPTQVDVVARQQARTGGSPTLLPTYERCVVTYPQTRDIYAASYADERKVFVAAQCTYQKGVAQGQADAQRVNDKTTTMPVFCDTTLFAIYLNGYLEGWKQSKDQICNPTGSYNLGIQQGTAGAPQAYSPPALCPTDYQATLQQKFLEGYNYGALQRQNSIVSSQISQIGCRWTADCRPGQWCRDRGDGVQFCMGRGLRGQFCQSSVDCVAGLFCRPQGASNINMCF